jgi:hypothetical protein
LVIVTWFTFSSAASSRDDQCDTPRLGGGGFRVAVTIRRAVDHLGPAGPVLIGQRVDPAFA